MSTQHPLSWKWILIGAGITFVLNLILVEVFKTAMAEAYLAGATATLYMYVALIAAGAFGVGGLLTGWFSPGETIKEPAIAAVIAVGLNAAENYYVSSQFDGFSFISWLIGSLIMMAIGFGLGMAGGWIGEKIQGDTTDKMRERGDLPPS